MKKQIRVYLRALEPDDYTKLHQWRQDEEYMGFYRGVIRYSSSLNEQQWVQQRINDKDSVTCAICMRDTHEFIGCTFLNNIDLINRSARGGTFIGERSQRGKGLGFEARMLILKHAFFDWGLERVWAHIHVSNHASIKMHEKCGYIVEGVLRSASFKHGRFEDCVTLAVLKKDFINVLKELEQL
jgi:RimJ/RimL family protein N-acetyltransferase